VTSIDLTRREKDVLAALCRPLFGADVVAQPASVREIATELVVTDAAVKQHLLHLYDKFAIAEGGERRRVSLARAAIGLGVVDVPNRRAAAAAPSVDGPDVVAARVAYERHEWESAAARFEAAAAGQPLSADDLVLYGEALLWSNRHGESLTAGERAYQAYLRAGEKRRAGQVAVTLTVQNGVRLDMAVAGGWLAKAKNLLESDRDCREHGYLAFVLAHIGVAAGDWDGVLELGGRMRELGERHGDPELTALGLAYEGRVLTRRGSVETGLRLLDEAMTSAASGELGMMTTGAIYCLMLCSCLALQDYRRAGEWTDVVDRCAHTTGHGGFPGDCRTHRTDVLVKRGAWAQGEEEAARAFDETQAFDLMHAGAASYSLGEVRLRRGDVDAAEEAFLRAHEFSFSPQPGIALVQLARGDADAAGASVDEALDDPTLDGLARARLLMARVEIALVQADVDVLYATADELEQTAAAVTTPALAASAAFARGSAELADGKPRDAARRFELAHQRWIDAESPYEATRARELHAQAQLAAGRADAARLALLASRAGFQRLGARLDTERVDSQLAALN
jgi:tetratricopeptide (TPR) repeat protein